MLKAFYVKCRPQKADIVDLAKSLRRGFARSVEPGWIVAVPRPGSGTCYLGRIKSRFELCDHPELDVIFGPRSALLQCKWKYTGSLEILGEELRSRVERAGAQVYVAVLFNDPSKPILPLPYTTVLTRRSIAELLLKHRAHHPYARTIGIPAGLVVM